jgi:hypothetical protein
VARIRARSFSEHLEVLAGYLADFDRLEHWVSDNGKWLDGREIVRKLARRAVLEYTQRSCDTRIGETPPLDLAVSVRDWGGLTDYAAGHYTCFIDQLHEAIDHLGRGGKFKLPPWPERLETANGIVRDGHHLKVRVEPIRRLFEHRDLRSFAGCLAAVVAVRNSHLIHAGCSSDPIQPWALEEAKNQPPRDDPNDPYWSARMFTRRTDIPAERLRQSARRGTLPVDRSKSLPRYSVRVAKELWGDDFHEPWRS